MRADGSTMPALEHLLRCHSCGREGGYDHRKGAGDRKCLGWRPVETIHARRDLFPVVSFIISTPLAPMPIGMAENMSIHLSYQ